MSDAEFKKLAKELAGKQKSSSSILLLVVITLVIVVFVWASVTEIDRVVRGSGKTVSEAQNQMVQSSEPGVIRKRYISEGDFVKKGQLLFDIDPIDAKTQLDQAQKRYSTLRVKSTRLKAEVKGVLPNFPQYLIEAAPNAVSTELALYRARLDDLNTKEAILEQRRIQKQNEIQELKIRFETTSNGLALIRREITTLEPLVKSGLAPETRLIALRRDEEDSIGRANQAESGQKRLLSGLDEIDEQFKATQQAYKTSALTDLSSIEGEISELNARIPALENRVERTSVKSPVDGVINRINYVTADAYISTGEVLLEIVPTGSDLIVETRLDPKDIADIVIGQDVKISLTAYDPSKFGRIDGKVVSVSADAMSDKQTGEQYYQVDISMTGMLYEASGEEVIILPGMVASIDVLSGKRTILDYFWQPISKTKSKAFRE
ncbi:HlyD family type I secretion periplasmic adaptor subunit [Paracoccaceae bacterium]|nr:HlyD family type I secretion periplasmic adaptor subunit [Paracoccaceae bacterium]